MHGTSQKKPISIQKDLTPANIRKRAFYWIGFVSGLSASGSVSSMKKAALQAEAQAFLQFFGDRLASDFALDLYRGIILTDAEYISRLKVLSLKVKKDLPKRSNTEVDRKSEFLGFCAGVASDGHICPAEATALHQLIEKAAVLRTANVLQPLRSELNAAFGNSQEPAKFLTRIQEEITKLVGPGFAQSKAPSIGRVAAFDTPITNPRAIKIPSNRFTLSGHIDEDEREKVIRDIIAAGGRYDFDVGSSTSYLVICPHPSPLWHTTHFGRKIESYLEIRRAGGEISLVTLDAFAAALAIAPKKHPQHMLQMTITEPICPIGLRSLSSPLRLRDTWRTSQYACPFVLTAQSTTLSLGDV